MLVKKKLKKLKKMNDTRINAYISVYLTIIRIFSMNFRLKKKRINQAYPLQGA